MNKKLLVASAILAAASMSFGLETWVGANSEYRVDTGLDDGNDESGYWYSYTDENEPGNSTLVWGTTEIGNEYDENALDPVIDFCGGLCGTATMGDVYQYPFVGVGFNITGGAQTGASISSWGGICITYKSTSIAPALEISPEDEGSVTEYNNYAAKLKVSATATTVDLAWGDFKQETGWGKTVDQSVVLGNASAIKFKLAGTAGKSTEFLIAEIGEYGKCGGKTGAISMASAASSVKAMLSGRTLNFAGINSAATAEVINLQGQVVLKSAIGASSALNLASLDAGVYMVRVSGKAVNYSQKIVLK